MKAENIGYLLWGKAGTGKSYFAGCIANALMEREISVCMTNFALILNDLAASKTSAAASLDVKPDLVKRIGNTTFDIHIHFSETSRVSTLLFSALRAHRNVWHI